MDTAELRGLLEEQLRLSRRLRDKIRSMEADRTAPLAIVGMAMRFPGGVTTPEGYWELLADDRGALSDIPADRPGLAAAYHPEPGVPGRSYVSRAGFLADVGDFDADFFGISQREALALDPQQRLLLETTWEALEHAGVAVRRSGRLDAGVFIGLMAAEYSERLADGPPEDLDPYYGTGSGHCFAAGRISYALGLRGPALTLDTACSSSLVALHTGARALRGRECRYAIVGGANLLFSPQLMVSLCQSRALAPDGRSKPFAAAADGYGRGEGIATLVLMRLDDAVAGGHPVLALLRGTAVNHDGASSSLTVPNGQAQQEVIQAALADAGASPAQVSYVEAHGTGTALGDPIEAAALNAVFGPGRPRSQPLLVGSVKARLGHLEAASGMAGLLKLVLMLGNNAIPADVTAADGPPSAVIPWDDYRLEVPRQPRAWAGADRMAGISAFGLSGTNAHAVLQAPPAAGDAPAPPGDGRARPELLVLTARTPEALSALAEAVAGHLDHARQEDLASACHTLRAGRAPLGCRLALTGTHPAELARKLRIAARTPVRTLAASRSAVLRIAAAPPALSSAVAAIAADLPLLAEGSDTMGQDTGGWLARALEALGLTVRTEYEAVPANTVPAEPGGPLARLGYNGQWADLVPADPGQASLTFLDALAMLYVSGADLRMAGLQAPGARFTGDLPTYPFQRKRYWIDEPGTARALPASPDEVASPGERAELAPIAEVAQAQELSGAAGPDIGEIERYLLGELMEVLRAEAEPDLDLSFAELGGDSFTAMLFVKGVEDRYQVEAIDEKFSADQPVSQLIAELALMISARYAPEGSQR